MERENALCPHGRLPGICRDCLATPEGQATKEEVGEKAKTIGSEIARKLESETGIRPYDVLMVLGAGFEERDDKRDLPYEERKGWGLNKEFRMRLIAAAQLYFEGRTRLICLTGGRAISGKFQNYPSLSEVAKRYLTEKFHIPEKDIILEDKSDATHGNLAYGFREIYRQGISVGEFAILSTNYHLNRAREMAKMSGIKADFLPAESQLLKRSPHYRNFVANWLEHAQNKGLEENEVAKLSDENYWRERVGVFTTPINEEVPAVDISQSVTETAARLAAAGAERG